MFTRDIMEQKSLFENEINQTAGHLRKTEDVLGNIGLLNQRSVPDDGIHGLGRCRSHVIEKQLSGKQVDRDLHRSHISPLSSGRTAPRPPGRRCARQ